MVRSEFFTHLKPGRVGESNIEQDQVRALVTRLGQRLFAGGGFDDLHVEPSQGGVGQQPCGRVVIDD